MKLPIILLLFLLFVSGISPAQEKFTISGTLKDATTGEVLIGANIYIRTLKTGTSTNVYGFYSLTLPAGRYETEFSYIGYDTKNETINLNMNRKFNLELKPAVNLADELIITAEKADENIKSVEMGITKFKPSMVKTVPILFGEQDILKTIQFLPGVKASSEVNSGFSVRGGKADQNLILLDEAPVYNAYHMLGIFSVFNPDAIKDVKLIKGSFPASYGGRLSSVLDMTMNEGNNREFSSEGGIGLIFSRYTLQGPIVKEKGSFLISGRRTWADQFFRFSKNEDTKNSKLHFYDLNMKANYQVGDNDRLFISGYFGRDVIGYKDEFDFNWGNSTATIRWNHIFSEKLFLNSSLIHSDFDYIITSKSNSSNIKITSSIKDINLKEDFQYFKDPDNTFSFGLNLIHHKFLPGEITLADRQETYRQKISNKYAIESAVYFSHKYSANEKLNFDYGFRQSSFSIIGPGETYSFDENGRLTGTKSYKKNKIEKSYFGFEPRLTTNFILDENSSFKASYARNRQYIHLLSNSFASTPLDVWQPSTTNVKPEIADQVALGYFRNLLGNNIESSLEVYYKDLKNQIEYRNNANIVLNQYVEGELVYGTGRSYGAELFVKKKNGRLTGWISYTLSKTERKFEKINDGKYFPAKNDRTHDFSIVSMYKANPKWSFSATWTYHTGDAVSFPSGKYIVDGRIANYYTERNGYRLPSYHRLDLGITHENKKRKWFESNWNFSLYNAYGRKNAFAVYFRESKTSPGSMEAVRVSLFKFFPTFTFNFKF